MQLSVLIVNWNARGPLARCLASLLPALEGYQAEVVVVDNGSRDGSVQLVRERFPSVTLITNRENRGFAAANNQAYTRSTGEFVLLLNPDVTLGRDELQALLEPLRDDPALGGTTPALRNADGSVQHGYHRRRATVLRLVGAMLHNGGLWRRNPWARRYLMLDDDLRSPEVIEEAAAACLLLRRAAVEQSGGLFQAERLPIHFNDAELARRLRRRGWPVRLIPAARVRHVGGEAIHRLDPYVRKTLYQVSMLQFARGGSSAAAVSSLKLLLLGLGALLYVLTWLGALRRYYGTPIRDRRASLAAQRRLLANLWAERLPPLPAA